MTKSRRGLVLTTALLVGGFLGFVVACQDGSGTPTQPTMDPLIRSGSGTTSDVSVGPLAESDDSESEDSESEDSESDDSESDDSESDDSDSEGSESECPCWTEDELDRIADRGTLFCGVSDSDEAQLFGPDAATGRSDFAFAFSNSCHYHEFTPAVDRFMLILPADATVCFDSIVAECADRTP